MSDQYTHAHNTFKDIPGFPGYRVGTDGSVWSCWRTHWQGTRIAKAISGQWKMLKPSLRKEDGRKRYTVKRADGTYRRCYGSHLVLESFVGPRPTGLEACHNNGDCTNDSIDNLRWDTHSANLLDRRRHGTNVQGEMVNTAKLTAENVLEIRRIGKPLKPLAIRFGVTETLVSLILKRKVWKHV